MEKDVSAPEFVDVHVLERERLAREGQVKTGTWTATMYAQRKVFLHLVNPASSHAQF
jgi:hypothetical protein